MSTVHEAEQFLLFDPGVDIARLAETRTRLMESSRAVNTVRAYASSWGMFEAWCRDVGRRFLPATSDTVSLFCSFEIERDFVMHELQIILLS